MIRLTTIGHEIYYASDFPRRFPLETDVMLRARLRRIMATSTGILAVERTRGQDPLIDDELIRAVIGPTAWGLGLHRRR